MIRVFFFVAEVNWMLGKEEDEGSLIFRYSLNKQSRYVVCVPLYNPFFSHTDLVPVVGPGSKELVTTPITGLRSLNTSNNTIQPLVYQHSLAPSLPTDRS